MRKNLILIVVLSLAIVACDNPKNNFNFTKEEKEIIKDDPNLAAQILVRKAVVKELAHTEFTSEEKKNLELVKEEAAINFFLQNKLGKNIQVSQEEVVNFYNENKNVMNERKLEEIAESIANTILVRKQNEALASYYNSLVDKYKLNDILKKEFPDLEKDQSKTTENSSEATTKKSEEKTN